jgi:electron transfer flavoprotein beta subunit
VVEPRYPTFKGIMDAKKKTVENKTLADLGVETETTQTVKEINDAPERSGGKKIEDEGEAHLEIMSLLKERKVI